jgi:hypothetical protein
MKPNSTYIAGCAAARQDSDGTSQIEIRQIGFAEYQSLPSIVNHGVAIVDGSED